LLNWLLETAAIFGVELSERQIGGYLKHLSGYAKDRLEYAINRTQQEWREAGKMPTPEFILTRCADYGTQRPLPGQPSTQEILDREGKPPGWEPVTPAEIAHWKEVGKRQAKEQLAQIRQAMREMNPTARRQP
jgi:hypothetical protein